MNNNEIISGGAGAAMAKEVTKKAKKTRKVKRMRKPKFAPGAHMNLRCETCGYYAKTTGEYMAKGRLKCPANPRHGILKTKEERGETRGRDFAQAS